MRIPVILLKHLGRACLKIVPGGCLGEIALDAAYDIMAAWEKGAATSGPAGRNSRPSPRLRPARSMTPSPRSSRRSAGTLAEPDRHTLEAYLMQVPASIRRTLRRPSDPAGKTVPSGFALKDAADLAAPLPDRLPRFQPGDRPLAVDRELVELLGVGGFGEVWKAVNPNRASRKPVALKFRLDLAASDRLLRHEARLLDRVMQVGERPGIVALKETYLGADPPCLEYEYVEGGELTGLILDYRRERGSVPPRGAARIVERLARTVGEFHRLAPPIVHRDLKPANILVSYDPEGRIGLKVADFGIGGLAAGREIERSQVNRSRGASYCSIAHGSHTPLYASPEQVRGAPPDPRDDVHALGVIWFQLLTGDLAHGAPTGLVWAEDLEGKGMSRDQIRVLASCVEPRQESRPADAGVLAEKLEAAFSLREKRADGSKLSGRDPASELGTTSTRASDDLQGGTAGVSARGRRPSGGEHEARESAPTTGRVVPNGSEGGRPRITIRGTLERFGRTQWNVLIRNVEEVVRFWQQNHIGTKLDWAGMDPPKATVGRKELLAVCDAAGEGAEVEYDLEVQDRANGRGTPSAVRAESHPEGNHRL